MNNFILNYKWQPIPIDSINKYWGIDAIFLKHDETLQKQSYDQSNKNFWSFLENNNGNSSGSGMSMSSSQSQHQSFSNSISSNKSGFAQTNFSQSSANPNKMTGLSYQEARTRAAAMK